MDSLLELLLNLIKVVIACRSPQLIVLPAQDILATALADSALSQEQEQIGRAVGAMASGQISKAACLGRLLEIVQPFASNGAQFAGSDERWRATATTLDRLLMLNALLDYDCARHSSFALDDSCLFDFIQLLTIEPAGDSPGTAVIGQIASHSGEIQINRDVGLLRRITIAYRRATIYPALTVKIPSTTPDMARQSTRLSWEQRDTPADDLALYSFDHRPLGQIITRRLGPPYELQGRKLTLLFSAQSDVEFLVTDVIDTENAVLGRYVKLI
jgi:hypothetical protein